MELRKAAPRAAAWMAAAGLVGALAASLVHAEGVPETETLVYTGRLMEAGAPATGAHDIRLTLWSDPVSTDATAHRLCRVVPPTDVMLQDGYFRIPLDVDDDSCEVAIADHSEVWYEVSVDGTTLAPRTQISAVPYALEANRASAAGGDLRRELDELVPAGTVISYAGEANATIAPPGWILCDGRALSSTDPQHARLFLAIRTAWGNGTNDADPATDFNVPDLRGRFLRGVDQGTGRDSSAGSRTAATTGGNIGDAVGTFEVDATALPNTAFTTNTTGNHTHSGLVGTAAGSHGSGPTPNPYNVAGIGYAGDHSHVVTGGGDAETRPANFAVNYLIRL